MQPPYIHWLHLSRLLLCGDATTAMLHVCESSHPVNTHRPSASRGAGVPYVLSASRGTDVPYVLSTSRSAGVLYVSEVCESSAPAIDLATGNRNVD